ncbi:MAG: hypothetical protein IPQ07_40400 [Myxococcales bacterium]|nr:hypothetical protein [Myxococcales bacterium]
MSYYVRYFADQPVLLKAIGTNLAGVDPQFKIDGGELMRGPELLGELEISASGSDLFAEDLASKIGELERVGTPAARQVIARLRGTKAIVTLRVLDGERDPAVTWDLISPLWTVLPALSAGLTQSDGQGFYDGSQLVVALA